MLCQSVLHNFAIGSPEQMVALRTYILFAAPRIHYQYLSDARCFFGKLPSLTLYPAAYPSPGKSEKNFLAIDTDALSLKITAFSCETEVIYLAHQQRIQLRKLYAFPNFSTITHETFCNGINL